MSNPNKRVVLPPALGCYVFIWEPRDPPAGSTGEPKYSVCLLWPKAEIKKLDELRAAIVEVATTKFGEKALEQLRSGKLRYPLRDGSTERPDDPVFADQVFITASSTNPPGVVDSKVKPVFEKDEAYSGCTFRASVSVFAYDNVTKGVGIGLSNLQVVKKGTRLDGRKSAEQDFEGYAEADAAPDPSPSSSSPPARIEPKKGAPIADLI